MARGSLLTNVPTTGIFRVEMINHPTHSGIYYYNIMCYLLVAINDLS